MKSVIVISESGMQFHGGEYYDSIIDVEDCPTTATVDLLADKISMAIRNQWHEDEGAIDRLVLVTIDAHPAFQVVVLSLVDVMKAEEGIVVKIKE